MGSSDVLLFRFCWLSERVHAAVHYVVEEFSILGVLHDHEDVVVGLDDLVELGDG